MAARHELLIADPTLRDFGGHAYFYDTTVAQAARRYFDGVRIFAHPSFAQLASGDDFGILRFPPGYRFLERASAGARSNVASDRPPRGFWALRAAIRDWAKTLGAVTCLRDVLRRTAPNAGQRLLFLQYVSIAELAALRLLLRWSGDHMSQVRFAFVLRYSPERFLGYSFARHRLVDFLLRDRRVSVFTDSEALTEAYCSKFSTDKIQTLPVPVGSNFRPRRLATSREAGARIGFLGATRPEKGFAALPGIIQALASQAKSGDAALHFVVQINPDAAHSLKDAVDLLDAMTRIQPASGIRVEALRGPLDAIAYVHALVGLDVMLLPYLSDKYESSTSGIFVECLQANVPCVTFRGTWPGQCMVQAAERGWQIGEVVDRMEDIPAALARIVVRLADYRRDLELFAADWLARRSPDAVAAQLRAASGV